MDKGQSLAGATVHPAPPPYRADVGRHGPPAPAASQTDEAVEHPWQDIQPRIIQPIGRDVLRRQVAIAPAGTGDVQVMMASHAERMQNVLRFWKT